MCQRCEELEEEVAYLRSELGISINSGEVGVLRAAIRTLSPGNRAGSVGVSRFVLALYHVHGRTLSKYQIMEALPPLNGGDDQRDPKIVDVWACAARKALGRDALENVWGRGVRLTDIGADLVGRILGHIEPIPQTQELQDRPPEELRSMAALIAGLLAHKDGDGGTKTAIADRLTGQPRVAA